MFIYIHVYMTVLMLLLYIFFYLIFFGKSVVPVHDSVKVAAYVNRTVSSGRQRIGLLYGPRATGPYCMYVARC